MAPTLGYSFHALNCLLIFMQFLGNSSLHFLCWKMTKLNYDIAKCWKLKTFKRKKTPFQVFVQNLREFVSSTKGQESSKMKDNASIQIRAFQKLSEVKWEEMDEEVKKKCLNIFVSFYKIPSLTRPFLKVLHGLIELVFASAKKECVVSFASIIELSLSSLLVLDNSKYLPSMDNLIHLFQHSFFMNLCATSEYQVALFNAVLQTFIQILRDFAYQPALRMSSSSSSSSSIAVEENETMIETDDVEEDMINMIGEDTGRHPQEQPKRLSLLPRDIIGCFWTFFTSNRALFHGLLCGEDKTHDLLGQEISAEKSSEISATQWGCHLLQRCCYVLNDLLALSSFHKDSVTKMTFLWHLLILYRLEGSTKMNPSNWDGSAAKSQHALFAQLVQCFSNKGIQHIDNAKMSSSDNIGVPSEGKVLKQWFDEWIQYQCRHCFAKLNAITKIILCRAIVTQTNILVLTYCDSNEEKEKEKEKEEEDNDEKGSITTQTKYRRCHWLLLDDVFEYCVQMVCPPVLTTMTTRCDDEAKVNTNDDNDSSYAPQVKFHALQLLLGWMQVNHKFMDGLLKGKHRAPTTYTETETNSAHDMYRCYWTRFASYQAHIDEIIQQNWDPFRSVICLVEELFEKHVLLTDMYDQLPSVAHKHSESDRKDDVHHAKWIAVMDDTVHSYNANGGKYRKMKILMKHIGPLKVFERYPNWIIMLLEASPLVGGLAVGLVQESLHLALLEFQQQRKQNKNLDVLAKWRTLWMDSLCRGFAHFSWVYIYMYTYMYICACVLCLMRVGERDRWTNKQKIVKCKDPKVQEAASSELLKYILRMDNTSYQPLLAYILQSSQGLKSQQKTLSSSGLSSDDWHMRALVAVLRCGRRSGAISSAVLEGWIASQEGPHDEVKLDMERNMGKYLKSGLLRSEPASAHASVRMECMEILCVSKRVTELPGKNTLQLLREIMPYWVHFQASPDRDRFIQLMQRLLARIKNGCYKLWHDRSHAPSKIESEEEEEHIRQCQLFVQWLQQFLLQHLYPGASVERLMVCVSLYFFLCEIFVVKPLHQSSITDATVATTFRTQDFVNSSYVVELLLDAM
ncbi:hypothetical protein RFI_38303, partial [Reticulomyxa filosa]